MKTFLFIVSRYHTNMVPMVEALQTYGHVVHIVSRYIGPNEDHSLLFPIVPPAPKFDGLYVNSILEKCNPDCIIIREISDGFSEFSRQGIKRGCRVFLYNLAPFQSEKSFLSLLFNAKDILQAMKRKFCKGLPMIRLTPVFGVKNGMTKPLTKYFPLPMRIDSNAYQRKYFQNRIPSILCVGKLAHPRKRHIWLIDALEEISLDCSLTIVGASDDSEKYPELRSREYYQKLYFKANNSSLSGGVKIVENVPYHDLQKLYLDHDIFVLPAMNEPFGVCVLEAMAGGCAVLAPSDAGVVGCFTNQFDGVVFNTKSYTEFRNRLALLLSSTSKIEKCGRNAISTISHHHSYEMFIKSFFTALNLTDS
jgi:glycosyltransferase involved in cell wall biosynthesis